MRKLTRTSTDSSAASMADIAFLLLIFFMVTTTIVNDKGLDLVLPPYTPEKITSEMNARNIFTVLINSEDKLLVENEVRDGYHQLREDIQSFIMNNGKDNAKSDNPKSAIISIKANRGATQQLFLRVLDEAKAAYYNIYAEQLSTTSEVIRKWDAGMRNRKEYKEMRKLIPMNISIAEPDGI